VLGIRGPGALVGELAAFDGGPRTASAIALDTLTVRALTAEEFRDFVTTRPGAALELIRTLMGRLRESDRRRVEFGAYDATARVARLLCDLGAEHALGEEGPTEIRLAQHEIAGLVGASRESVARALAVLRKRRMVATGRGTVTLLDADALRTFTG
jgi:CRP/FNR family cyclic AMP-dependent transcriptional regulator